jgi:hypothetical protein
MDLEDHLRVLVLALGIHDVKVAGMRAAAGAE